MDVNDNIKPFDLVDIYGEFHLTPQNTYSFQVHMEHSAG